MSEIGRILIFAGAFGTVSILLNVYALKDWIKLRDWKFWLLSLALGCSPIFYRFLDRWGLDIYPASGLSLVWLGLVTLYFFIGIIFDGIQFLVAKFRKAFFFKSTRYLKVLIVLILGIWGLLEPYWLQVHEFKLMHPKIHEPIKIIHLSDWHFNQVTRNSRIKPISEIIQKYDPDLIVATGDMIDGNMALFMEWAKPLSEWRTPYGKIAIFGNHEYYHNISQAREFLENSGFTLLVDESLQLREDFVILGLDDPERRLIDKNYKNLNYELLSTLPSKPFRLVLKHKPVFSKEWFDKFDLALCGHTHGGVFFPVRWVQKYLFIGPGGLYRRGNSFIFVSHGIGTGGPPMRIGAPPDLAFWEIRPGPSIDISQSSYRSWIGPKPKLH